MHLIVVLHVLVDHELDEEWVVPQLVTRLIDDVISCALLIRPHLDLWNGCRLTEEVHATQLVDGELKSYGRQEVPVLDAYEALALW